MNPRPFLVTLMLILVPLGACQSSGGSSPDPASSMARLPESTRSAADGYITAVSDLSKQLIAVTDTASARAAMPSIESAITRISQAASQLVAASAEAKSDVGIAFGRRIRNVNDSFAGQVDRIKGTPGIGTTLGPLLDKVRVYR